VSEATPSSGVESLVDRRDDSELLSIDGEGSLELEAVEAVPTAAAASKSV
jgi:hypothetical protein